MLAGRSDVSPLETALKLRTPSHPACLQKFLREDLPALKADGMKKQEEDDKPKKWKATYEAFDDALKARTLQIMCFKCFLLDCFRHGSRTSSGSSRSMISRSPAER